MLLARWRCCGKRPFNQSGGFGDARPSVRLTWLEKSSQEARAQRANRVLQPRILGCVRAFEGHVCHASQLSRAHGKSEVDQLVSIVDVGFSLNLCLEISIVLKKLLQGLLRQSHSRLVVRIFIRQIHHLQKASVGKNLRGSGEVDNSEEICGLKQKIQTQTRRIGNDIYLHFGKFSRTFESGNAGVHLFLRIGFSGFLRN